MRIHSICLVKNEADVIEHCLGQASAWSDFIYVFDNGSDDGTWEIVSEMANDQIVAWRQEAVPYRDNLRSRPFNAFRHQARAGDWWCKLDADEFYLGDPKSVLGNVPWPYHVVYGLALEYYLTREDVDEIDFKSPVDRVLGQIRYHKVGFSEQRFFRHRDRLTWANTETWPRHMGPASSELIPFRHYKYRSPRQIQSRLDTRRQAIESGYANWQHASQTDWRCKLADRSSLSLAPVGATAPHIPNSIPEHRGTRTARTVRWLAHVLGIWP